jgi:hypothetical protein
MSQKKLLNDLNDYRVNSVLVNDSVTLAISRITGTEIFGKGSNLFGLDEPPEGSLSAYGLVHEESHYRPKTVFPAELELRPQADGGGMGNIHIKQFGDKTAGQYLSLVAKLSDPDGSIAAAIYRAFTLANTKGGRFIHVTVHKTRQDADEQRALLPRLTYTGPAEVNLVVVHQQALMQNTSPWSWLRPWRGYPLY